MFRKITLFIASIALSNFLSFAQSVKNESTVMPFTALEISNEFDVVVIAGSDYNVETDVDKAYADFVRTNVKGSTLYLSLDEKKIPTDIKKFFSGKNEGKFKAIISTPGNIETITLNGHSILTLNQELLSKDEVTVSVTDNSILKSIAIKAVKVNVNLAKKADATLDVETEQLFITASGSSSLEMKQSSDEMTVDIQGNSELSIRGKTKNLHYQSKNTSKCKIIGQAENAVFNCSGSSNTDAVGMEVKSADVKMNSICVLSEAASEHLNVDLSGGASLIFAKTPQTNIINIKSSSMTRYEEGM